MVMRKVEIPEIFKKNGACMCDLKVCSLAEERESTKGKEKE